MPKLSKPLLKPSYCQIQTHQQVVLARYARALHLMGRRPSTVQTYLSVLRRLARYVADLMSPTPEALRAWARAEAKRLSRSSYNASLTAARSFYREMHRWEYCPVDHGTALPPSWRAPQRIPRTLDADQIAALRSAPDLSTFIGFRDHVILSLLAECGLRPHELIQLTVAAVLPDPGLYLRGDRRRPDRFVPISPTLYRLIQGYLRWRATLRTGKQSQLFLNQHGRAFHKPHAIWRIVQRYAHAVALPLAPLRALQRYARAPGPSLVTPTILRASVAAHLLNRGMGVRDVQVFLGHQHISTTVRYESLDMRVLKAEHAKCFSPATQHSQEYDDDTLNHASRFV